MGWTKVSSPFFQLIFINALVLFVMIRDVKSKLLAIAVSSIIVALVANASYANVNKRPNLDGLVY
jgi:hypothetical protein